MAWDRLQGSGRSEALLSREEEEAHTRIEGVPTSFTEAAVFWETSQPSNRPARSCSDCSQRTGVARPLIPDAVPHPCDSCRSKPVLRGCEDYLTGCAAYCLEKSRLDLVLSASFSRMHQLIGIVNEQANTPLSQNQVWFMRQASEG